MIFFSFDSFCGTLNGLENRSILPFLFLLRFKVATRLYSPCTLLNIVEGLLSLTANDSYFSNKQLINSLTDTFLFSSFAFPQHTTPLQASLLLLLPLQKFSSYHSLHFPFVFIRVPFVFHSCSLVFTRVHLCSTRVHSCSTRVHSCSFVFIRVHSCSFVFRSVWCFRYDRI